MKLEFIKAPELSCSKIMHGFFTRNGGVSNGIYRSLNTGLGSNDNRANVIENRKRVCEVLKVKESNLLTVYQTHSTEIVEALSCWPINSSPRADGLVTNQPGIALAICTADCGPVLLADKSTGIIGAAHAGWRGAFNGILENIINKMESLGANKSKITAILGPTISGDAYEVGPEFVEQFTTQALANESFFKPSTNPNHSMFDLPNYIVSRLKSTGIRTVSKINECTFKHPEKYFSYRKMQHNGENDYGRLMSVITILN